MFRVVAAVLLLSTGWNATAGGIVAVGPNPVAVHDRGEYVVLSFPRPIPLGNWSIDDGEARVGLPDRTVRGRVVLTRHPPLVDPWTDDPVLPLDGRLALANAGETLILRRDGVEIDRVTYRDAPEGHRFQRTADGWRWRREGLTDLAPVETEAASAEVFVLPDDPTVAVAAIATATERVLLGAYTFSSRRTAATLCRARSRNVTVRVLVDGGPVGGMTRRQAATLDSLSACGVQVTILGGPHDRYAFHHAKYAVVDDRALVLTENWKPSGVGGRSSRGWGAIVADREVADGLAAVFAADSGWRDAIPWREYRAGRTFVAAESANGTFRTRQPAETVPVDAATLLVTPDNAERALVDLLDNASTSIDVQQVSIGRPGSPLVRALRRAAGRGVRVRLLLSGAWYVREENRAVARRLSRLARREALSLEVRLANPAGRFDKLHSKGFIVDDETVVVGSINWNNNSLRRNREVAVVLEGDRVAAYYGAVFLGDWRGGRWLITVGVLAVALGSILAAGCWTLRSVDFGDPAE